MLKIPVAVDGSDPALAGVRHVVTLVQRGLRAHVVLGNVQEPASLYELVTSRDPERIAAASTQAGQHLLASASRLLSAAGIPFEKQVEVGEVAHTLVDLIERHQCDLVVIGAMGQGAIAGALLGSVSQALAQTSPVPVTIVHPRPAADPAPDEPEDAPVV